MKMNTNYSQQSHTTWECNYHVVVVPKYRKSKLFQVVRKEIGEIMKELSKRHDFEIIEWNVAIDHVHMLLKIPPKYSVSSIVGIMKGKSAIMLHNQHGKKKMLGQKNFWSRGYFVTTAGIDLEIVRKYIQNQNKKDKVEDGEQLDFNW